MFNGSNCDRKSQLSGILTEPLNPRVTTARLIFLRNLLPLQAIHLTTILSPLSSNVKPFFWENEHTLGFEKIKELLASIFNYTEGKTKNAVNIIYTDSSLHLIIVLM